MKHRNGGWKNCWSKAFHFVAFQWLLLIALSLPRLNPINWLTLNGPKSITEFINLKLHSRSLSAGMLHNLTTQSSEPVANSRLLKGEKPKSVTIAEWPAINGKPLNRPQACTGRTASAPRPQKHNIFNMTALHDLSINSHRLNHEQMPHGYCWPWCGHYLLSNLSPPWDH